MLKSIQSGDQSNKRESTTIWIDPTLWKRVRIWAIQNGTSATWFFEKALVEKLEREI